MRFTIHYNPFYIQIHSNKLLDVWTSISLNKSAKSKAGAFFPFIFTTDRIEQSKRNTIINHELIHFAQQKEMLIVGSWVLFILETIYFRYIKRLSVRQAYLSKSVEQEAYANMFNFNYLTQRPAFNHLRTYIAHKPITWDNMWDANNR